MSRSLLAAPLLLLLGGCATFLTSERDTGKNNGVVYSLPIPVIYVVPQPNGTMKVSVEYFADPDNSYVIRTSSLLSSYTLDVQRNERGLLTQVSLDAKSDAVAAAAAESAGNVAKAQADAQTKSDEAAAARVDAQTKAVADAQLEYDIAKAKYDLLVAKAAPADKQLEAELALTAAQAKLLRLQSVASGANLVGGNVPPATAANPGAAAPVMFRVMQTAENGEAGVKLVAFEGPRFLPTSSVAKPDTPHDAFMLTPTNGAVVQVTAGKAVQLLLVSNTALRTVRADTATLTQIGGGGELAKTFVTGVALDPAAKVPTIIVNLADAIPKGSYFFNVTVEKPSGEPMLGTAVQFTVNR
jgi:multidrug efflux pump subunit AcrA (membrane-fusion protein)